MLVHVQRQDRHAAGQRMRMVGRPLVDQRAFARLEHEQHPARAAAVRLAHRNELLAPSLDAAEVGGERQRHRRLHRLPVAAVVVLVVAGQQPCRQAAQRGGIEGQCVDSSVQIVTPIRVHDPNEEQNLDAEGVSMRGVC